jgi:DHA1 family tetracycline resistance protein-like MFS transporter
MRAAMTDPSPRRAALAFVYVTALLDMVAFGVVIPVLPFLIKELTGGEAARAAEIAGGFGFVFALMQFVFGPVLGSLSDHFGRRPIILLSNLGLGLDYVLMALAPNLGWLLVGRVIAGITSASFATASAYVADTAPPEKRASGFGMLGALFGVGFVVGPLLGGVLGNHDPRLPFWCAAVLSLANALYGLLVLPESLPADRRSPFTWARANPIGSIGLLRSRPQLVALATVVFLNNLGHDVNPHVFVFYASTRYGWDAAAVGATLMAVGVCSMIVSGGLVGPIVRRLGESGTLVLGLVAGVLGFALQAWAPSGAWFRAGIPLVGLWGIYGPALQGLMVAHVAASEQGQLQGALQSLRGFCELGSPLLYTQVFARFSDPASARIWIPGAPYWLATVLVAAALAVALPTVRAES